MSKKATAIAIVEDETPQIDPTLLQQMLGAARYANHLSNQTKSDVIRFLKQVRDDKLFLQLGFQRMDEFLDSDSSPLKRATFYRELEFFEKEGEQYDLFNEWKIPARIRRQLQSGDIAIDGDDVVIAGDERVSLSNSGSIKAILEQLVKEKNAATEELSTERAKTESTKDRLEVAQDKLEYATAEVERLRAGTPYDQALRDAIVSLLTLTEKIGQLGDADKQAKGPVALPQLETAIERVAVSFGLKAFGGAR